MKSGRVRVAQRNGADFERERAENLKFHHPLCHALVRPKPWTEIYLEGFLGYFVPFPFPKIRLPL